MEFLFGGDTGVNFLGSSTRALLFGVGTGGFFLCGDSDCSYNEVHVEDRVMEY